MLKVLLLLGSAVVGWEEQHGSGPPPEGHPCQGRRDCPKAQCHAVDCLEEVGCSYERLPPGECCLTSEECCEIAGPREIGVCDKNCTCQFVPGLQMQCTRDADCRDTRSGWDCLAQGPCFHPVCEEGGWCGCLDGRGLDLDHDGELCPPDCNDLDPTVCMPVTCITDRDSDGYPSCAGHHGHGHGQGLTDQQAAEGILGDLLSGGGGGHGGPECRKFCIEPGHTCPVGWTNPWDPHRWHKPHSEVPPEAGRPCYLGLTQNPYQLAGETTPVGELTVEGGVEVASRGGECDCCDVDRKAYPGSPWAGSRVNNCGAPDYNCNGEREPLGCCTEGWKDPSGYHHVQRYLWNADGCLEVPENQCGGCRTQQGVANLTAGWACEDNCDDLAPGAESSTSTGPATWECPVLCRGACVCTSPERPPQPGQCAKLVSECIPVDEGVYGDSEQCCVSAIV